MFHNYFIGNHKKGTGGIRIIGENQNVHGNYLIGLNGEGLRAAITIMNGIPQSPLNGYWQVKNAKVQFNIIINCKEGFHIGVGKSNRNTLPPIKVRISRNILHQVKKTLIIAEQKAKTKFSGNSTSHKSDLRGFMFVPSVWLTGDLGLPYPDCCKLKTPFWLTENIGVTFIPYNPKYFKVKN